MDHHQGVVVMTADDVISSQLTLDDAMLFVCLLLL